jgi:N-methylhydantoinase A/oxoprolinase/acetone carboxylase beta subunit
MNAIMFRWSGSRPRWGADVALRDQPAPRNRLRLGVDVGGTNTDAVLLDAFGLVVAKTKTTTTADVSTGIGTALDRVLAEAGPHVADVTHVMLGTTHATNAVLERQRLGRVAVLRLAAPATTAVSPLFGWPADLRSVVCAGSAVVGGGTYIDGRRPVPLDRDAIRRFLEPLVGTIDAVAVTGMFSPVCPDDELEAADLAREVLGDAIHISLSHEIGSLGLIERENATALNAALVAVATDVATALQKALAQRHLHTTTLFAQNDGTLMSLDFAMRYPVLTIGSGPANSIRGAAYLSGVQDAVVIDVGGTSTDVGVLIGGHPRESTAAVEIGGVRTNFRMPDLYSVSLGGGTIVTRSSAGGRSANGVPPAKSPVAGLQDVALSQRSVGRRLVEEALIFGGATPTLTDASVLAGRADIGNHPPVRCSALLREAMRLADESLAEALDRVKVSRADVPVVAVGGGSHLIPDALPGASEVLRPRHYDVANAVGAAIALASGRWEEVVPTGPQRAERLEHARDQARRRAVQAGADARRVEIVEMVEVPLSYLPQPAARVTVKAAGPLAWT